MILNAVRKGVPEERLARALNVNISNIRVKRNLLVGICPEVSELLRDRHVPIHTFRELKRLVPLRQIDVAQAMIAMNKFSVPHAKSLVASTPADQLVDPEPPKSRGLTADQIAVMQRESENLDREFRAIESTYGADHLDLIVAIGYVSKVLGNVRIVRYLAQQHPDLLSEFQKCVEYQQAA